MDKERAELCDYGYPAVEHMTQIARQLEQDRTRLIAMLHAVVNATSVIDPYSGAIKATGNIDPDPIMRLLNDLSPTRESAT